MQNSFWDTFTNLFGQGDLSTGSIFIKIGISVIIIAVTFLFFWKFLSKVGVSFIYKNKGSFFNKFLRTGLGIGVLIFISMTLAWFWGISINTVLEYEIYKTGDFLFTPRNIIVILLLIFFIRIIILFIEALFEIRISQYAVNRGKAISLMQIVKYLIWVIGFLLIVASLGLNLTFVVASVSALLIGVGFGLQSIISDIFSGIIILFDGSMKVGDVVELEKIVGRVLDIGIRATKVETRDNLIMIIPNSHFTSQKVINWSHMNERSRFNVTIGVAYGSNVLLVKKLLLEAAKDTENIANDPKPFVRFTDFGESSLDFQLFFWSDSNFLIENIKSDLRFLIDAKFRNNKITIPFPQRDLHIRKQ